MIGLAIGAGGQALAANNFYLNWGRVGVQGFAFVGRIDRMRDQCDNFMRGLGLSRVVGNLYIRDEPVAFSGYTNEACAIIVDSARDLGPFESQNHVSGQFLRTPFSFAGTTSNIVSECVSFLSSQRIRTVQYLEVFSKKVPLKRALYGPQACGEIASRGLPVEGPFDQYYVAGDISTRGFAIASPKAFLISSCKGYLDSLGLRQTTRITFFGETFHYPNVLRGHAICDEVLSRAMRIQDPGARFQVSGRIGQQGFWFAGTISDIVNSCQGWAFQWRRTIGAVRSLIINDQPHKLSVLTYGAGLCGILVDHLERIEDKPFVHVATGSLDKVAFAWTGAREDLSRSCSSFVRDNNMLSPGELVLRNFDGPFSVPFELGLRGEEICGVIAKNAVKLLPPQDQWSFDFKGFILSRPAFFRGEIGAFMAQCRQFFRLQRFRRFGPVTPASTGEPVVFPGPFFGEDACMSILSLAETTQVGMYLFLGGRVDDEGISIATERSRAVPVCVEELEKRGILVANEYVVFDELYTPPAPIVGPEPICQAMLDRALILDRYPEVMAHVAVGPHELNLDGPVNQENKRCVDFVKEHGISLVQEIVLDGSTVISPNRFWSNFEICSVAIKRGIDRLVFASQ